MRPPVGAMRSTLRRSRPSKVAKRILEEGAASDAPAMPEALRFLTEKAQLQELELKKEYAGKRSNCARHTQRASSPMKSDRSGNATAYVLKAIARSQ